MTTPKTKYRTDRKTFILGLVVFAVFLYASSYMHEYSHALVCELSGFESKVHIMPYTFETRAATCFGSPENYLLYWSIGGAMGAAVSLTPLAFLREYKFVVIGCLPNALANAITGSMETFVHDWYINTEAMPAAIASVPMVLSLGYLLSRYSMIKT